MRILLDENLPHPLRKFFLEDEVRTVQELGWSGVQNGELIARANACFDVLVLADKNLRYQQNLRERTIALVELPTNRWPILKSLASRIVSAVQQSSPGAYVIVTLDPDDS